MSTAATRTAENTVLLAPPTVYVSLGLLTAADGLEAGETFAVHNPASVSLTLRVYRRIVSVGR